MTFGISTLNAIKSRQRGPAPALYDCGGGKRLSVRQIAVRTGLSHTAVVQRIRVGITGAGLLASKGGSRAPVRASLRTAVRLARAFPCRVPTTAEIRRVVPMSEATASRYRAALRETLEAA